MQFADSQQLVALIFQHIADMDKLTQLAAIVQAKPNLPSLITHLILQANHFIRTTQYSNAIRLFYFSDLTFKGKSILSEALEKLAILVSYNTAAAYFAKQDNEMSLRFLDKAIQQLRSEVLRAKNKQDYSARALLNRRMYGQGLLSQAGLYFKIGDYELSIQSAKKAVFSLNEEFKEMLNACQGILQGRSVTDPQYINMSAELLETSKSILQHLSRVSIYEDLELVKGEKALEKAKERLISITLHERTIEYDFRRIFEKEVSALGKQYETILKVRNLLNHQIVDYQYSSTIQLQPIYPCQQENPFLLIQLNKNQLIARGLQLSVCLYLISSNLILAKQKKEQEFDQERKQSKSRKKHFPANGASVEELLLLKAIQIAVELVGVEQPSVLIKFFIEQYLKNYSREVLYQIEEEKSNIDSTIQHVRPYPELDDSQDFIPKSSTTPSQLFPDIPFKKQPAKKPDQNKSRNPLHSPTRGGRPFKRIQIDVKRKKKSPSPEGRRSPWRKA